MARQPVGSLPVQTIFRCRISGTVGYSLCLMFFTTQLPVRLSGLRVPESPFVVVLRSDRISGSVVFLRGLPPKAIKANLNKLLGQYMQQKTMDKCLTGDGHRLFGIIFFSIAIRKSYVLAVKKNNPAVGYGHAMV